MFDWGLFEVLLVLLVALVVLGPRRVANMMVVLGRLCARVIKTYQSFSQDVSQELMQEDRQDASTQEKNPHGS